MRSSDEKPVQDISICDLAAATREQDRIMSDLSSIVSQVGGARAMREISSDLRKKILSRLMKPHMDNGDSAAAAECKARASQEYSDQLHDHQGQLSDAETIVTRAEVLKMQAEAVRTKISLQKSILNLQ